MFKSLTNLHPANLLIGSREEGEIYLDKFLSEIGFKVANNPDLLSFRIDVFGIDEARQLKSLAQRKSISGIKVFFISPLTITLEAQNALLKTFEEPMSDTRFLLVVREEKMLLPTLLSRMQVLHLPKNSHVQNADVEEFLSMLLKDRLQFTKNFIDEEKNLLIFLDELMLALRKKRDDDSLRRVFNVRKLIRDNMPPRLVLEHLALML